ncbi:MAG TPA: hypothetical protein VF272_04550 [Candidatus Saccharimonadia bacterium]
MRNITFGTWREKRWVNVLIALSVGLLSLTSFTSAFAAGNLTNASATLSDPRPEATAASVTYNISWKAATTATLQCFTYRWSTSSNPGQGSTPTGFSNAAATNGTFTNLTAANWTIDNSTAGTVKNTYATGASVPANTQITTPIQSLTNPTFAAGGTYYIEINTYSNAACSTLVDSTVIGFVTVPGVLVSAIVDSTLTFTVAGVASSTTYKGSLSTADRCTDTATAVTFGSTTQPLAADTNYDCAQTLTTSTNANGGYQVTVQGKQTSGDFLHLLSDPSQTVTNWTGTNGTPTATPTSGASEVFGYTTADSVLSGTPGRFTTTDNLFAGLTTTPAEVAYNATAIANDATNVGYRLRITGLTEAGTYQGTLVYTCTPVF